MRAHVEALPQSCLLTLSLGEADNYPLAQALRRVLRSQSAGVWVDCRHVATLSADALRLLRRCAASLWARGGYVVLCHLPAAARAELGADATQPLAASLLDAQHYGLDCPISSIAAPESAR